MAKRRMRKASKPTITARAAGSNCMVDISLVPYDLNDAAFGPIYMTMRTPCTPPIKNCGPNNTFANVNVGAYAVTITPSPCSELGPDPYYVRGGDYKIVLGSPSVDDLFFIGPNPQNFTVPEEVQS
jgi:hypothetical protein